MRVGTLDQRSGQVLILLLSEMLLQRSTSRRASEFGTTSIDDLFPAPGSRALPRCL